MRCFFFICSLTHVLAMASSSIAEPFKNLDFEMAQIPEEAQWGDIITPEQAIPFWDTNATEVGYHGGWGSVQSHSHNALLSLQDAKHTWKVLEGRFTVRLDDAWISQRGDIPRDAVVLQYLRSGPLVSRTPIAIDGQPDIVYTTYLGNDRYLERFKLDHFAGENVLLFINHFRSQIDQIEFSRIPIIAGDTDADGDVDTADLNTIITNWTGALDLNIDPDGRYHGLGDTDLDRDRDTADLTTLALNFTGAQGTPQMIAVLEPASALFALGMGFAALYLRGQKNDSSLLRAKSAPFIRNSRAEATA